MSLSEPSDTEKNKCFKGKGNELTFSDLVAKDEEKQNEIDIKQENSDIKTHVKRARKSSRKKIESLQTSFEIYQCVHCPQTFNRLSQLKSHSKSHLGENSEKLECNVCSVGVDGAKSLTNHRRQHAYSPRSYKCLLCNTEYNHQTSFRIHMRIHKGEKPYVCKECGASFSQSGHLSIHKRTHTGEKPYTCEICSNNFKQISHLKTHVRTHTHDKPYRCNLCSAAFTQNSSLKRHNRVHTGEKPYQCVHCGMNFVVKSNMQRHLNTHTGERPFQCDLCPASFGQAIDLKRHKISHTGVKPYKCELCNASFSRKNNLKWHKLTHSENAGFHCNICFVGFSSTGDLKTHMRTHAPPKPYSCDICPSSFRLPESLNKHKMIHTGEIPLRHKSNKQNASKEVNSKPFNCLFCNASFCEKRNLKRHTFSVHNNFGILKSPCSNNQKKEEEENLPCESQTDDSSSTNIETQKTPENYVQQSENSDLFTTISAAPYDGSNSNVHQVVMQSVANLDGASHVPQFFISAPGQAPRPARPAGYCQNHNLHILTYVEGSFNHWQSWCFCYPPNLPESPQQVIVPSISTEMNGETMAQILFTPTQTATAQDSSQILMNMNPQPITDASNQIFFSPTFLNQNIAVAPNYFGTFALNGNQPFELQGGILQSSSTTLLKGIKSEN